jgi:hypothetical protein
MIKFAFLSGAALLGVAGIASAQPGDRPGPDADVTRQQVAERIDRAFARMDANHDGRFTPDEARAGREQRRGEMRARMFDRLDANHDGNISRDEFAEAHAMRGGPGGRHRFMRHMGPDGPRGPEGRGPGMRGGRMFGEQGFVTAEQMRARALARFDRADSNHDGTLTAAERREAREHRREHRMERRDERGDERPGD